MRKSYVYKTFHKRYWGNAVLRDREERAGKENTEKMGVGVEQRK